MEGCRSNIHIPCERGPYSDIKKQNTFQICRGKFLRIFRQNLSRVPPCPSTWHKNCKFSQKILKKCPFSTPLHSCFQWQFLVTEMYFFSWIRWITFQSLSLELTMFLFVYNKTTYYLCINISFVMIWTKTPSI